jgi:hypothetical protein
MRLYAMKELLIGKSEDELMDMFDASLGEELESIDHFDYAGRFMEWLKGHGIAIFRK